MPHRPATDLSATNLCKNISEDDRDESGTSASRNQVVENHWVGSVGRWAAMQDRSRVSSTIAWRCWRRYRWVERSNVMVLSMRCYGFRERLACACRLR